MLPLSAVLFKIFLAQACLYCRNAIAMRADCLACLRRIKGPFRGPLS